MQPHTKEETEVAIVVKR